MSCLHCYKFLLWYVHVLRQPPFVLPCKRIRIPRDFFWWNAESGKCLLVGSETLGFGIQNPEFHEWLGSGILVPLTKNSEFSTCISRIHSVESRSQDCLGFQWRIQERGPGAQSPLIFRPNWGPKGRKKVLRDRSPPIFRVRMTVLLPSYWKVWIRYCIPSRTVGWFVYWWEITCESMEIVWALSCRYSVRERKHLK